MKAEIRSKSRDLNNPVVGSSLPPEEKRIRLVSLFRQALEVIGLDIKDDSIQDTPRRMAKMWVDEIFSGLDKNNHPKLTFTENKMKYDQPVIMTDIELCSTCEHHFIPFVGRVHIAYIPNKKVVGLSKLPRLVRYFATRPQVQERLTAQLAEYLREILETESVAVVIDAVHLCVKTRGIKDSAKTRTPYMTGAFKKVDVANYFLNSIPRVDLINYV